MKNISIDLDGVLCDFYSSYFERFGLSKEYEITKNVRKLSKDKEILATLFVKKHNTKTG